MKKIMIFLITIILIITIYRYLSNRSIKCIIISDKKIKYDVNLREYLYKRYKSVFVNNSFYNKKIEGIINDIKNNRTIKIDNKEYYLKKQLRESDYIIIDVTEEFNNYYNPYSMEENYIYFSILYQNLQNLFVEIHKYVSDNVIFLGFYNPSEYYDGSTDKFFYSINLKLRQLTQDNDFTYISTYELIKGNPFYSNFSLNLHGNNKIAEIIDFYIN